MLKTKLHFTFLFFTLVYGASGQNLSEIRVTNVSQPIPLTQFLLETEKKYPVRFFYREEWLTPYTVDVRFNGRTLEDLFDTLFGNSDIGFTVVSGYAVVLVKSPDRELNRLTLLKNADVQKKKIAKRVIGKPENGPSGKIVVLKGTVKSESSELALSGTMVFVEDLKLSATTDANGQYRLSMPEGDHVVSFRMANFADQVIDLSIYASGTIDVMMEETPIVLQEVEISDQAILNRRLGQSTLTIKDMKRAPSFLGEVDLIRQVQTQAGVTTTGEMSSGFSVRGGSVDQNLVLFDGMPVFNTSHALGFFTAFNADAIHQVSFYRGAVPAEYGGRVSSVLDITSEEGSRERWKASGGIGLLSSHLSIGGAIKKDTTSVMLSFRSLYSDWLLNTIKTRYQDLQNSSVAFYDGSFKLNHRLSSKTKLTLAAYTSHDRFSLANDTLFSWRSINSSLRIDHTFSDRMFSSVTLGFGKYTYTLSNTQDPQNAFRLDYGILYPSMKIDFNRNGKHELSFGLHNTFYDFSPGKFQPANSLSALRGVSMPEERSLESALYFSDGFYWRENIYIEAGLRYSIFNRVGSGQVYQYKPDAPLETRNIVDSVSYRGGDIQKTYQGAEPRLSIRFTLNPKASIKVGYNRNYQYIHLVSNTAAVTPVDIWQSSNAYFRPQIADQFSTGYFRNIRDNLYEFSAELFYKRVQHTLDFKDGADLILNKHLETALLPGTGYSYGAELSITKNRGKVTGYANYTFSRSLRKVNGAFDEEKINQGNIFPSNYDQPHVMNINARFNISRRFFLSGNFTYRTGRPISLPVSVYRVDWSPVSDFSERNHYRIPDYHRLDLAFIVEGRHKRKKLLDGTWSISVYNVYGRKNVYSIFFKNDGYGTLRPYKLSIIGTALPSVSYSFKI